MKRPRKPALDPDDAHLFRASVADVTPLPGTPKVEHDLPLLRPIPARRHQNDRQALQNSLSDSLPWDAGSESGDELSYARNGIDAQTIRRLRRGHWAIQDELDLHGSRVEEARTRLAEFLGQCTHRGLRCVRVIHGKGLRSKNREPVLKQRVAGWMMQRDDVLAFCQASRQDGGGGAVVVLLKSVNR